MSGFIEESGSLHPTGQKIMFLDDRYKKQAIEYLDNLTQLVKDKPEDFLKVLKENLDGLADVADKGAKLATFGEKHLPTFMMTIGALRLWFGI